MGVQSARSLTPHARRRAVALASGHYERVIMTAGIRPAGDILARTGAAVRSVVAGGVVLATLLAGPPAAAAVSRIEVLGRAPVAGGKSFGETGPYEIITGRLHYAVDPDAPANGRIVDLGLAPRDATGRVAFLGDFVLVKPRDPRRANGRLLYGVNNRGNIVMLHAFNDARWSNAPTSAADFGNGFLLERGYTLLWSAWNWDVVPGNGRLQIELPVATDEGRAITGAVASEMTTGYPAETLPVAWGGSRGYPPAVVDDPGHRLTVRASPRDERRLVPRGRWRFVTGGDRVLSDPVRVTLDGGFGPGLLYELVYEATDPRVVGLGLAAIRDALSFFRYAAADEAGVPNPLAGGDGATPEMAATIVYGFSQSARVIQHMLLQGFHVDEAGRPAFDAALIHAPGAGKGSFNHRFAQTTRHPSHYEDHLYPADFFPFTTAPQRDPLTGRTAGLLDAARRAGAAPKLFYLSASTEYWTRAASLLHTDVEGRSDIAPDARVRIYAVAGAQHGVSFRIARGAFENCRNPLDDRPLARALLLALDAWATKGQAPPASAYPRIADGALGTVAEYRRAFPDVPSVTLPTGNLRPPRLDHGPRFEAEGIADLQPPAPGPRFVTLVPLPDGDGLDRGGIRLPEMSAPLGAYLGWNLRRDSAPGVRLGRWEGSFLPFHATESARRAAGDPRPSIAERYGSEQRFLELTAAAAAALVQRRLLLSGDVPAILARARRAYRALTAAPDLAACAYLDRWRGD